MDFGIQSPEHEKGVVIGAMTPKGTLSGMIMGGCGEMFALAQARVGWMIRGLEDCIDNDHS